MTKPKNRKSARAESLESIKPARAFAWELPDGLCEWAESSSEFLLDHHPGVGAKIRAVVIMKLSDYRRLLRAAQEKKR